jgi:DNA-binding transcriptional ArsR family regulator
VDGGPYEDTRFVKAVDHPLRLDILRFLRLQDATVRELADELAVRLEVVSYHGSVLVDCDCLELVRRRDGCPSAELRYRARPRAYPGHPDWRAVPHSARASTAIPDAFLNRLSAAIDAGIADTETCPTLTCLEIDVDIVGAAQIDEIAGAALAQVQMVQDQSRQRIQATGQETTRRVIVLASFEAADRPREAEADRRRA